MELNERTLQATRVVNKAAAIQRWQRDDVDNESLRVDLINPADGDTFHSHHFVTYCTLHLTDYVAQVELAS
jgi:hypothetical protein